MTDIPVKEYLFFSKSKISWRSLSTELIKSFLFKPSKDSITLADNLTWLSSSLI